MRTPALLAIALALLMLAACESAPPPTATPTVTLAAPAPTPSPTPAPFLPPLPPPAPIAIPTPTSTATAVAAPPATATATPTRTPRPTPAPSPTPTELGRRIAASAWASPADREVLWLLGRDSPAAFDAFMDWMGDGEQRGTSANSILGEYWGLANTNEEMAVRILRMPFLEEVEFRALEVMDVLHGLARGDPEGLERLLGHPALEGGIADEHAMDVFLIHLERRDPAAAEAVRGLPWVRDGIDDDGWGEDAHVINLVKIALPLPASFEALMDRPWTRDGITDSEGEVIHAVTVVPRSPFYDEQVESLLRMPFLGSVDETDAWLVRRLLGTLSRWVYGVRDIVTRPEVQPGVTDAQRATVALWVLDLYNKEGADRIRGRPWLSDGLQPDETPMFITLWEEARFD